LCLPAGVVGQRLCRPGGLKGPRGAGFRAQVLVPIQGQVCNGKNKKKRKKDSFQAQLRGQQVWSKVSMEKWGRVFCAAEWLEASVERERDGRANRFGEFEIVRGGRAGEVCFRVRSLFGGGGKPICGLGKLGKARLTTGGKRTVSGGERSPTPTFCKPFLCKQRVWVFKRRELGASSVGFPECGPVFGRTSCLFSAGSFVTAPGQEERRSFANSYS